MYVLGTEVDEDYKLKITPPKRVYNTSEFCADDDLYQLLLIVPKDGQKSKKFTIHLYASNSNSNPYMSQETNYWKNLVPTWKFYNEKRQIIYDIDIVCDQMAVGYTNGHPNNKSLLYGYAKFHYVDDMPSSVDAPVYIWATLNLDEFTKDKEVLKVKNDRYEPPIYSNSKVIAVSTATINPVAPTKISITRNSKDLLSTGIYWSNQLIPFIATINSDHYKVFREESDVRNDHVDLTSDIVYNYPPSGTDSTGKEIVETLTGNIGIQWTTPPSSGIDSAIEKYVYFTRNEWDFFKEYLPPENVLETSSFVPPPKIIIDPVTHTSASYDVLEIMDFPTYDDLKSTYPDINLDDYFIHECNKCSASDYPYDYGPDINYITLDEYKRLISEHKIFDYVPYALRIADTLTIGSKSATGETWCNFSGYYTDEEKLEFRLLDTTNGYNYKIGGYSFGKTYCPDLSGEDRIGKIHAYADINKGAARRSTQFHIIKYNVIQDGRMLYLADDRNRATDDYKKAVKEYLQNNNLKFQEINDHDVPSSQSSEYVLSTENPRLSQIGGLIGAACVTQDPLYNTWVVDSDTGYAYKYDIAGEIIHKINLNTAIDQYIKDALEYQSLFDGDMTEEEEKRALQDGPTTQEITEDVVKYWEEAKKATATSGDSSYNIAPAHIVLDGKNNLYITCFDQMMLIKMDGLEGKIKGVWPFPDCIVKDNYGYSTEYEEKVRRAEEDEQDDERLESNAGWKVVGVDTNEYNEVAVLFQTRLSKPIQDPKHKDKEKTVHGLTHSVKIAFFNGEEFTGETIDVGTLVPQKALQAEIPNLDEVELDIDTAQIMFRTEKNDPDQSSKVDSDFIYITGTMQSHPKPDDENSGFGTSGEYVFVWRYEINRENRSKKKVMSLYFKKSTCESDNVPKYHYSADSLFMDVDENLWFALNKDGFEVDSSYETTLINLTNIKNIKPLDPDEEEEEDEETEEIFDPKNIHSFSINESVTGIAQTSNYDMLLLTTNYDKASKKYSGAIKRYRVTGANHIEHVDANRDIPITAKQSGQTAILPSGKLFANGDWSGADYLNKYNRPKKSTIETVDDDGNIIKLYSYEKYYIRKHNEEWDVAEHAKIPVMHTTFFEDNPDLFKSIGVSLGVDEHKHYSIGKKLFEGIANQVNNIHDIDECHIDSIYNIAHKEDVNIDKFILSYPEELRRMVDIMSITRKKLWGERCHCTQNYKKTKHPDDNNYCEKCRHAHRTNLGPAIDPFDPSLWSLTEYRKKYGYEIEGNTWYTVRDQIPAMCDVFNSIFMMDYYCKRPLRKARESIEPINKMLDLVQKELYVNIERLSMHSDSYDVLKKVKLLHAILMALPNAYLIEDKFNRGTYTRITISVKSLEEAKEILNKIRENSYLTEVEKEMMARNETNSRIILQTSVLQIEEQARNIVYDEQGNPIIKNDDEELELNITAAQLLAIHTSFFTPDQWFNYCYWHFLPRQCHTLNTSVINWDSKYTTLPETDAEIKESWYFDPSDDESNGETGTMEKILNYILHNGTLFHRNKEYIDD